MPAAPIGPETCVERILHSGKLPMTLGQEEEKCQEISQTDD